MVKVKREQLARQVKAKLVMKGKTIADFCRELGVSYKLYKDYMNGIVNGKRAGKTKVRKLIEAIQKLLNEDADTNKKAA